MHNKRQRHRLQAILSDRLQELRTDRVADAEKKEQKQERFRHRRNRNVGELSDEYPGKEGASHGSKAKRSLT